MNEKGEKSALLACNLAGLKGKREKGTVTVSSCVYGSHCFLKCSFHLFSAEKELKSFFKASP